MIENNDIEGLWRCLEKDGVVKLSLGGDEVIVRAIEDASKIALSTPVYVGSAFMPHSVRESLQRQLPFDKSGLATFLTVDEYESRIFLNYVLVDEEEALRASLKEVLDTFAYQAAEWRFYLDEQDRRDWVYVRAR